MPAPPCLDAASGSLRSGRLPELRRRHQTCYFRKHASSAPAELGGEIHNAPRNRAHNAGPSAGTEVARLRTWHVLAPSGELRRAPCAPRGRGRPPRSSPPQAPRARASAPLGASSHGFFWHRLHGYLGLMGTSPSGETYTSELCASSVACDFVPGLKPHMRGVADSVQSSGWVQVPCEVRDRDR